MGLFCGKTCKCKNRCEADLRYLGNDAVKGCEAACKTDNKPDSGWAYLNSLPEQSRILLEQDYFLQNQFQEQFQEDPGSLGISPELLGAIVIAILLLIIYLKKRTA